MLLQLHQHPVFQREQLLEAGQRNAGLRSRLRGGGRRSRLSRGCAGRRRSTGRRCARRLTRRRLNCAAPDVRAARGSGRHGWAGDGCCGCCRCGRSGRRRGSRCRRRRPCGCRAIGAGRGAGARRCGSRGRSTRCRRSRAGHGGVRQRVGRLSLRMRCTARRLRGNGASARRSSSCRGSGRRSGPRRRTAHGKRARRVERGHIEHSAQLQATRIVAHERGRIRVEQRARRAGERGAIVRLRDVDRHVVERLSGAHGVLTGSAGSGCGRHTGGARCARASVRTRSRRSRRSRRGVREAGRQQRHGDRRSQAAAQLAASLPGPNRTSGFNGIESNDHWNRLRVVTRIVLGMEKGFAAHNKKAPRLARRFLKVGYAS